MAILLLSKNFTKEHYEQGHYKIMTTFIQAVALAISIVIMILVVKLQVDDDIKKMQKKFDKVRKERNK